MAPVGAIRTLVLVLLVLVPGLRVDAQTWTEFGLIEDEKPIVGDNINEPFFAFLVQLSAGDSLGVWDGEDVRRFAASTGGNSRFPLAELVQIRRRKPTVKEIQRWAGVRATAHWDLELTQDLDRPMPYDILGYHPGSLQVSRHIELMELDLGTRDLSFHRGDKDVPALFREIRVFALIKGHMILDADGFVDALLGSALDDAWTVGLVIAREGERRIGLGVSLGRKGRKIYGEFDFVRDKVLPHGRPAVSALSAYCRRWLNPGLGMVPAPWTDLPDS